MAVRPCCFGCSLQTATKWIAILQIVFMSISVALVAFTIGMSTLAYFVIDYKPNTDAIPDAGGSNITNHEDESNDVIKKDGETYINIKMMQKSIINLGIMANIIALYVIVFLLILAVELLKGAKERNLWKVNFWFRIQIAQFFLTIITTPIIIALHSEGIHFWVLLVCLPIRLLIDMYFLWIVYCFMKEIRKDTSNAGEKVEKTSV